MRHALVFFAIFHWVPLCPGMSAEPLPAFPGAEGAGMHASGGRAGRVLFVTTLEDYAPDGAPSEGSLRAAVDAEGPRTVVFRVSGNIDLDAPLRVREPYLTIAGQTAPGGGICLRNHGLIVQAKEVVIRHIRVRPGDRIGRQVAAEGTPWETDAITIRRPARRVIIDHCSASWANDEVLSVSGAGVTDITVQWCIISESMNESTHGKGRHGYASLIRTNGEVTYHHNLYAFHFSRSPRPGTYGEGSILFDFRNNLMHAAGKGYTAHDPVRMNFVGNYHPTTPFDATGTCSVYVARNIGTFEKGVRRTKPYTTAAVATTDAKKARRAVLAGAGATRPARDPVDLRIVEAAREETGVGTLINSQDDVGGWPELVAGAPPADTDSDGMADVWERANGLVVGTADHNGDADGDGYTNLEAYLNHLAGDGK